MAKDNSASLEKIEGRAGLYLHQIKFYMNNGEESPMFGGSGGDAYNHVIPAGQHIVSATFKTLHWLDSVTLKTNEG